MRITENFDEFEFSCLCGCGFNIIDPRLVNRLQVVRDIVNIPIKIHSGCRCVNHNDDVGGENGSLHLLGLAADWSLEDGDSLLKKLCEKLIGNWSGGFHYYELLNFVHTDIGKRRRW
ncbi:MAG: hypothetical protein A2Z69_00210 [Bacteroidetes bacterium RBG_13_44_24]|nr:MAG: hypothetical protein A2Z69_00210 [Bacteroidetes bacterium RBG_13_44_24]